MGAWNIPGSCKEKEENMKRKKFLAAILAVAMIFTSIQLPPVQVSAEEVASTEFVKKIDANQETVSAVGYAYYNGKSGNYNNSELGYGPDQKNAGNSAELSFSFYGDTISVIGTKIAAGGTFNLYIDDSLVRENVPTTRGKGLTEDELQKVFTTVYGLEKREHNVRLVADGEYWVSLDAFEFTGLPGAIAEAEEIMATVDASEYSEEFYTNVNTALNTAKTINDNYDTETLENINNAVAELRSALDTLKTTKRKFNSEMLKSKADANSWMEGDTKDGPASWAFDNPQNETWWHTNWGTPTTENIEGWLDEGDDYWILTGFDKEWYIETIEYTSRPSPGYGMFNDYEIYVTSKVDENGKPVFDEPAIKTWHLDNKVGLQKIELGKAFKATHVRINVKSLFTNGGNPYPAARNISILGYDELPAVDKTALEEAIAGADEKIAESDKYNVELFADLERAYNAAIAIRDKAEVLQSEVDEAKNALLAAIASLKLKTDLREFNFEILKANAIANSWRDKTTGEGDGYAGWAFDDNNATWWHSKYTQDGDYTTNKWGKPDETAPGTPGENPIWIQTGFNNAWYVKQIDYTVRANSQTGQIKDYEIQISNVDKSKEELVDSDFTIVDSGVWDTIIEQGGTHTIILNRAYEARYVRLVAKSVHPNTNDSTDAYVAATNITIKGYDELPAIEESRIDLYDAIKEAEKSAKYYDAEDFVPVLEATNNAKEVMDNANASQEDIQTALDNFETAWNSVNEKYLSDSEAKLSGNSLTLKGTIDVNFYMTISEEVRTAEGAYLNFTIDREGTENDQTWRELLAGKTSAEGEPSNVYLFNVGMPIKDMDTEIKVQIIIPGKEAIAERKGLVYTYSVADYIESAKTNPGGILGTEDPDEITEFTNLVNTMSDFGDFATAYFAEGKVTDADMLDRIDDVELEDLTEYVEAAMIPTTREIYYGSSLLLKADTELRHYFNEEVEIVSVTVDGEDVASDRYAIEQKKGTSKWYLEYTGIGAHELGNVITVTVETMDDETSVTIEYSPLTYAYIALANEKEDTKNLADLMRAMYLYQQAAVAYNN